MISKRAEATVVVGKGTVLASNFDPQAIAIAVPLSVMSILKMSPSTGVPLTLVVIEAMLVL